MLFTWLPLNLPNPPEKFITQTINTCKKINSGNVKNTALNQDDPAYLKRKLLKDGKEINSRIQYGFDLGSEWEDWVRTNIYSDFVNTGGRYSVGEDTVTHGAHTDSRHNGIPVYKLFYLIDPGGSDTTTVFFKEHNKPIERAGSLENVCCCDDYSKLEVIDKVKFPVGQWVLLNTNVLHGVEDVVGDRINLAVIFATNNITKILPSFFKNF